MVDRTPQDHFAELERRLEKTSDAGRPKAVAKRRKTGQRTVRENIADLVDEGTFVEYGALAVAAQRQRYAPEELAAKSPADGIVCGLGSIDGHRAMILAYDYTVFAGTQGAIGHKKLDRMLELAAKQSVPIVLFAEGGGGRPNDVDVPTVAALDTPSFHRFAALSGRVPRIGIVSGRCFAGNAALLGCCDVIIATKNSNVGMGGPAMIEGGGLGKFTPEEIGPIDVMTKCGVVDVSVEDEAEAVTVAKRYLSYFAGPKSTWTQADPLTLRDALPERRRRAYKIRPIVETIADIDSVLELRRDFGRSVATFLARLEGRPVGIFANDTYHLGGALDADAADKAARFLQLCDAFGLPVVSLCDTPGFMVGPESEAKAAVRHVSRMFTVAANLRVPFFTVVLRKGYGLGAQAMAGGHFHAPVFTVAWPTGEFGAMNLEGAVRLSMKRELEAIEDPEARAETLKSMVGIAQDRGRAVEVASLVELDAVIDPAHTRRWLLQGLHSLPEAPSTPAPRWIDTW